MRVWNGTGGDQGLGVGVVRFRVENSALREFNDLAQIHYRHSVADVLDHAQIMGDKEVGQLVFLLEVLKQVDHLGLDRPDLHFFNTQGARTPMRATP